MVNSAAETTAVIAPTGTQYVLESGGYRAVVTELGAGIRELSYDGSPILLGFPESGLPVGAAGELLVPWPNRVAGGRYTFDGVDNQLAITEPARGNAIHGLARMVPWLVADQGKDFVRLEVRLFPQAGYQHILDVSVEYRLDDGLGVEITTTNRGTTDAPYGVGSHPYLTLGSGGEGSVDEWRLRVPASRWLPVDDRMIPTGEESVRGTEFDFREPRAIGGTVLDSAFTGIERDTDGIARVVLRGLDGMSGVELRLGSGFEWLQLFTGDALPAGHRRAGIAVEPMTCPPDAFNSGAGLLRLAPGQSVTHRWSVAHLKPLNGA